MSSFFDKLAGKLGSESGTDGTGGGQPPANGPVKYAIPPNGEQGAKVANQTSPPPKNDERDEEQGTPLDVDLFQSEGKRMIVFAALHGVQPKDIEVTLDEESNTAVIHVAQNRPDPPLLPGVTPEKGTLEKGRFLKQEVKWDALYRKVYLPAPFSAGESQALLKGGALILILPERVVGQGRKVVVKEVLSADTGKDAGRGADKEENKDKDKEKEKTT